jgi:hypothetical protein
MESETSSRIRETIVSGEYENALGLWNGYAGQLANQIREGALPASAMAEASELVTWSRTVLRCAQAHILDHLKSLHAAEVYGAGTTREPRLIRISL